jgi:xanthine dehydrogenase accessory factor
MEDFFQRLHKVSFLGKKVAWCVVTSTSGSSPRKAGSKMIVFEDETISGSIGGGSVEKKVINEALNVIKTKEPAYFHFNLKEDLNMECGGTMDVYIEPVLPAEKLYVFGAGHIGKFLAKYAPDFDFDVILIDERPDIIQADELNPGSFINKSFSEAIPLLNLNDDSYMVIVTHKHINDEAILRLVCKLPHKYLGMIGSKLKIAEIKKRLIDEKVLTDEEFNRIDTPIGIKFAAETPQEIAVSILAKLIDVKNSK